MPDVRSFMASGYNRANDKIYLVSGYNDLFTNSGQPNTWEYDPVANTFTERAPFPHPAGGFASGIINGHMYVAGGYENLNALNLVWDYDIAANTWTQRADMPGDQNNVPGSAVALDRLWVFGGGNQFAADNQRSTPAARLNPRNRVAIKDKLSLPLTTRAMIVYDPTTDTWSSSASMNVQRSFPSSAVINDKLIAAGGYNGFSAVASVETLDVCIPSPQCDSGIIVNGGFETGNFTNWTIGGTNNPPVVTTANPHTGIFSALAGNLSGGEPMGDSSFYQEFTVPATGAMLSCWHWDFTTDTIGHDWQRAYITNGSGVVLQPIFQHCIDSETWVNDVVDLTPYAGQTVRVNFLVHQDGYGDVTGMYVDDVALLIPCATPTPTVTPTPSATATPSPTSTPTLTPTATPTPTPRSTPTPRPRPAPRPRPTPPR